MSRVGNKPVELPEKVTFNVSDNGHLTVEGPLGKLEWQLPEGIKLEQEEANLVVSRPDDSRKNKALHGTARSLVANMVEGVSKGFKRKLEIHGVGFRAAVKGSVLDLSLGFSHPVEHPIPEGVSVKVEDNCHNDGAASGYTVYWQQRLSTIHYIADIKLFFVKKVFTSKKFLTKKKLTSKIF